MKKSIPSIEEIRNLLDYDPETGVLTWKATAHKGGRRGGREAFTAMHNRGYRQGAVNHFNMLAHRVAWAIYYGTWPKHQIDHINGIKTDNRIENLRDVTPAENQRNLGRYSNNKSGLPGVTYIPRKGKWDSRIKRNGKIILLGTHACFGVAMKRRLAAMDEFGFSRRSIQHRG